MVLSTPEHNVLEVLKITTILLGSFDSYIVSRVLPKRVAMKFEMATVCESRPSSVSSTGRNPNGVAVKTSTRKCEIAFSSIIVAFICSDYVELFLYYHFSPPQRS